MGAELGLGGGRGAASGASESRQMQKRRSHGWRHSADFVVSTRAYGQVVVQASDGRVYHTDLGPVLSEVHCYPKDFAAWALVTPDADGRALVWTSRFEVHVDQVIALAHGTDATRQSA